MKIFNRNFYYGIGATVLTSAVAGLFITKHSNSLKQSYSERLQNMEYVKRNAPQKYINTLEELNKSNSPRIVHENIDALWSEAAIWVKDSLELTKSER